MDSIDLWLGVSGPCPLVYDGPESGPSSRVVGDVIVTIRRSRCGVRKHIYMRDVDVQACRNERAFRELIRLEATLAENDLTCQCEPVPGYASEPWVDAFWIASFHSPDNERVFP